MKRACTLLYCRVGRHRTIPFFFFFLLLLPFKRNSSIRNVKTERSKCQSTAAEATELPLTVRFQREEDEGKVGGGGREKGESKEKS